MLTAPYLSNEWRPDLITKLLDELVPEKCRIVLIGQSYEPLCNEIEPHYKTKYGAYKIDAETLSVSRQQTHAKVFFFAYFFFIIPNLKNLNSAGKVVVLTKTLRSRYQTLLYRQISN